MGIRNKICFCYYIGCYTFIIFAFFNLRYYDPRKFRQERILSLPAMQKRRMTAKVFIVSESS